MALVIRCAAQPSSTFGSPDALVERGTAMLAKSTAAFGLSIVKRIGDKSTPKAIRKAIDAAERAWPRRVFQLPLERELKQGQWLGALDADFEADTGRAIKVLLRDPKPDNDTDPAFAKRSQHVAEAEFLSREVVTRDVFDQMDRAAQRRAFTVAGTVTKDVARTVKRELARQVAQGAELRDFKKHALARLKSAGWTPQNPSHAENVLRTNVLGAYNSGRARQMSQPAVLRARPYWQILTVNDGPPRQRKTHQAAHGIVLRADDPFWREAYPPFGYQCRCRVRSLSQAQAEAIGITSGSSVRGLPDPGFASGFSGLLDVPIVRSIPAANDVEPAAAAPAPSAPRAPALPRRRAPAPTPPPSPRASLDEAGLAQHLESIGVRADDNASRQLRAVVGDVAAQDVDAFFGRAAFAELPGARVADMMRQGDDVVLDMRIYSGAEISGRPVVRLMRTFSRNGKKTVVKHDLLTLDKELQGGGMGARVIADQVRAYERLGIDEIRLDAAWIGQYYWPKLGFECTRKALPVWVGRFRDWLHEEGFTTAAVDAMTTGIKSMRDIAITMAGERKVGKDYLLNGPSFISDLRMPLKKGKSVEIMKKELGI